MKGLKGVDMPSHDEIRTSVAGRSLDLGRSVAETFRQLDWTAREGAAYMNGLADVAATRAWQRKDGETWVHVVVRCALGERVLFSEAKRETEDIVASYASGDLMDFENLQPSPPPPAAPPARFHAAAFRADDPLPAVINGAFAAIDDLLREIHAFDLDIIRDDIDAGAGESEVLDPLSNRRHLVHSIVVTDAALWTLGDNVARHPWLRLHRARVIGADDRWIDVAGIDALEKYAGAITRYYSSPKHR